MATFNIDWASSPRIVEVAAPDTDVTVQELVNALRDAEDELRNMGYKPLAVATGKDNLGGGLVTGIVLALQNAKLKFADRAGPSWERCTVKDGTLVAVDGGGSEMDPIESSDYAFVVVLQQQNGVLATDTGSIC
jgi:hypothetical protein